MISLDQVLARVKDDPITHLSCRSLRALEGYIIGYDHACMVWRQPRPADDIDHNELWRWLRGQVEMASEHAGRLNSCNWLSLATWARFLAEDDREAFDIYFQLRAQVPRIAKSELPLNEYPMRETSLIEVLQSIHQRPAMYFGNAFRAMHLWSFCSGFRWAERDRGLEPSLAEPLFTAFSNWLAARYPFSRGVPWHRLFNVLALEIPTRVFDIFIEHLELFLADKPPDTPDPTMALILENIQKQFGIES